MVCIGQWWNEQHKQTCGERQPKFCQNGPYCWFESYRLHSYTVYWQEKTNWPHASFILHSVSLTTVACGRSICSHNSLTPSPHAGHQLGHILLWDGIPFLNKDLWQVSQGGSVGHSTCQHLKPKTRVNASRTPLTAILEHFWPALPTRLPMFLIPKLLDAYHAAPRWKGLE